MIIDCDTCEVRGLACGDCVVSVLLGPPGRSRPVELDDSERTAIGVLADSGMVPPLRLVAEAEQRDAGRTYDGGRASGAARAG